MNNIFKCSNFSLICGYHPSFLFSCIAILRHVYKILTLIRFTRLNKIKHVINKHALELTKPRWCTSHLTISQLKSILWVFTWSVLHYNSLQLDFSTFLKLLAPHPFSLWHCRAVCTLSTCCIVAWISINYGKKSPFSFLSVKAVNILYTAHYYILHITYISVTW